MANFSQKTNVGDAELHQRHDRPQVEISGAHGGHRKVAVEGGE
jgi:hypothetical protein